MTESDAYRRSGVDLLAAADAVERIRRIALGAARPEAVESVGGFAGLYDLGDGRLLAAATDGVGTKTEIARRVGRLDTIGIDLVAMCANDVACTGAEPILFLDYLAVARLVPEEVAAIVSGVAEGCRRAGCALLGGETAEHPGVLEEGRFDVAGFCVGHVARESLLGPARVCAGDALVGLPATGLHANGFSLVRRAVAEAGLDLGSTPDRLGRRLADELLEPTAIYAPALVKLARAGLVGSAAHITGGGLAGNLPRALPPGLGAEIDPGSWERPRVFGFLASLADMTEDEQFRTFNMGIGMALTVSPGHVDEALDALRAEGFDGGRIGRVIEEPGVRL